MQVPSHQPIFWSNKHLIRGHQIRGYTVGSCTGDGGSTKPQRHSTKKNHMIHGQKRTGPSNMQEPTNIYQHLPTTSKSFKNSRFFRVKRLQTSRSSHKRGAASARFVLLLQLHVCRWPRSFNGSQNRQQNMALQQIPPAMVIKMMMMMMMMRCRDC